MAKLLAAMTGTRQDAALLIADLKEAGVKKGQISVLARTEEELEIISRDTGLPKPKRGDGNHALFHPLIEVTAILEGQPANVAAIGPAAQLLAGSEIGKGSDDFIVGLMGAGIPENDARLMEESLIDGGFVVFVECEDGQYAEIGRIIN
ncbi:hypothetical protein V3851_14960 [Paenibacillus sp. M1]|uniref:General stress protein 17M-like domain-containing protein n=1 Tax=Paenibacillus haidiansis TaxID=1574488 RepID=A0ABU7VTW1_9BACL